MSYIKLDYNGTEFSFHERLYQNISKIIKANKNDWDFKILISGNGMTRTGKSTLAAQLACVVDPKFTLDQVIFKGDKLVEHSKEIGKHRALVYDEAKEGLDSKKAITNYSNNIMTYFAECGWLNQFMIIVLPDFFDLNKSIALNQSIFLINCYTRNAFTRGYFNFYNRKGKRYLYIKGKKYYNYDCQTPTFQGTFTKWFPFDKDEYEKRKAENQKDKDEKKIDGRKIAFLNHYKLFVGRLIYKMHMNGMTKTQIAKLSGTSVRDIGRKMKDYTDTLIGKTPTDD